MNRTTFEVSVDGGVLGGWHQGSGSQVLILHGGPGLSYGYADTLAEELGSPFWIASFQQRGLAPSTESGPFTIDQAVQDVLAVLEHLDWSHAFLVGHSWGGHLALQVARAAPDRLGGALLVDSVGAVGDGGLAAFEAEMLRRTPLAARERAEELDERAMRGEGSEEEAVESLRLMWPAYFADPSSAPAMPPMRISVPAYAGLYEDLTNRLPELEQALSDIGVPVGVVAGARSPMPVDRAAVATAARLPQAWTVVVKDGGHFPWQESPGSVRAALDRLVTRSPAR